MLQPKSKTTTDLWCIRIVGPDDLVAAPSKAAAEKMAADHNLAVRKIIAARPNIVGDGITEESMLAVVEPWPWSAEAHAKDMKDV